MTSRAFGLLLLFVAIVGAQTSSTKPRLRIPPGAQAGPGFSADYQTIAISRLQEILGAIGVKAVITLSA
jgi:hypothetical protein